MILAIDNYDSFTYNLVQYLGELGAELVVYRNDKIDLKKIGDLRPERIIISPGPGYPSKAGISEDVIRAFAAQIPILGVCLGHQAIAEVFGGRIVRADRLMHGKTSAIRHNGQDIFKGIKNPFEATRYHSLIVERVSLPGCLSVTAETGEKEIMGIKHKKYQLYGVQFHPESILTKEGKKILGNFLKVRQG
ncbi:MAG: aminodeoxychorismate/anthranilate synthase component II [Candidatus Omnitrophota bacterium]|nr:aminodeoxychorismate/anthranilate synthase component II [Candidatus Omnitrophota bacterium]